jgi:uridine phosphorylase
MLQKDFPILEYDNAIRAVIEPTANHQPIDIPEHCVLCFFDEVIDRLVAEGRAIEIYRLRSEIGFHQVYKVIKDERSFALMQPGVGAPLAAGLLEELIALGAKKFIACGGAGVLDRSVCVGQLLIPLAAIRDEGLSYHYLPPSREVEASSSGIAANEKVLAKHRCQYILAKTWTTDAIYRETIAKVQLRKTEGCLTVEMECAAFFAVAQFRKVLFAQILYGGDDVSCDEWDSRGWNDRKSVREKLLWFAAEACLEL